MSAKKSETGRRLTPQQRSAITSAPAEVTNTALAEKYKTTLQTVARYRQSPRLTKRAKYGSAVKTAKGGIQMQVDGDFIVLRIPKRGLLKGLVGDLFG